MAESSGKRWAEAANRDLRETGHRAGGARGAVVDLLSRQTCCLSAQRIAEGLESDGTKVGLASVYRALEVLHGIGLVQRVDLGDGELRWEPVLPGGEHHHHAVCDTCGRVTAFEDEKLESALERLAGKLRHSINAHEVVIHGACKRCAGGRARHA